MPYALPFFYMVFCKHNTDGHAQEDCKVKDGKPTCWGLPDLASAEWIVIYKVGLYQLEVGL